MKIINLDSPDDGTGDPVSKPALLFSESRISWHNLILLALKKNRRGILRNQTEGFQRNLQQLKWCNSSSDSTQLVKRGAETLAYFQIHLQISLLSADSPINFPDSYFFDKLSWNEKSGRGKRIRLH